MAAQTVGQAGQISGIKQFDGTGFSNWEFRIGLFLEQNKLLEATKVIVEQNAAGHGDWKTKDVKARNIIAQCVTDNVLESIKTKSSAKTMLETLRNTYCNAKWNAK